ncbi:MAG: hypothetical protein B6D46_13960 [Polyangiaceae bacterium UTPRO1]|nr:hypothetical protein [Myxococcales bacterium]OQY65413.1 MAG: hypothetical protein B6D46_13960 [Polyangiaceae bacterium UTPRO1]
MSRRARRRSGATWWALAAAALTAGLLGWWLAARRTEAPGPAASQPEARAPSAVDEDHDGEGPAEITSDEKAALEHILRERNAAGRER